MLGWQRKGKDSQDDESSSSSFVDLAPTSNANVKRGYEAALRFALDDDNVRNIALAGPYGSGKSSIIRTFAKRHPKKYSFLNVSLATFREDVQEGSQSPDQTLNHSVERSILQQLLYGADASELPYSRFKRIVVPKAAYLKSLLFVLTAILGFVLYRNLEVIYSVNVYSDTWWTLSIVSVLFVLLLTGFISSAYRSSFQMSLKKISLTNAEIETASQPEDSILNRHLDEILYFFQVTEYDVVVFEDLDRFKDPSIFVKLREINKLVNDNANRAAPIKFLYALCDDIFLGNNRPKFFDLIVPVIPVINSSNSIDKVQERVASLDPKIQIDPVFLREVSLYLDDYRLIHNIFNEFVIYHARLTSQSLNNTRLLAMLIYKNAYPSDFHSLHSEKGAYYRICQRKSEFIGYQRQQIREEIEEARNLVTCLRIFGPGNS